MWALAPGVRVTSIPFSVRGRAFPVGGPILWPWGWRSHPQIRCASLTLEANTLGFRALTCLPFTVRTSLVQPCCACRLLFGVYINVFTLDPHSKDISRNHKYMYPCAYIKYIYENEMISIRNTASVIELFF